MYMKYMRAVPFLFLHQMQSSKSSLLQPSLPYLQIVARVNGTEEVATGQQKIIINKQTRRRKTGVQTPSHDAGCRCFRRLNAAAKEAYPSNQGQSAPNKRPLGRVEPPVRCSSQKSLG